MIFKEGEESDGTMYFVTEGEVSIFIKSQDTQLKVNTIKPGKFFGEIALLKNLPRTAAAIVSSPSARIARLDRTVFMQLARVTPEFLFAFVRLILDRLIIAEHTVKKLSSKAKRD